MPQVQPFFSGNPADYGVQVIKQGSAGSQNTFNSLFGAGSSGSVLDTPGLASALNNPANNKKGQVLGANTTGIISGGGGSAPNPGAAMQTAQQFTTTPSGPSPEELAAIDSEFNSAISAADASEGFLRQQAGVQTSQAEAGYEPAKTQIQQEGDIRTQDLNTQATNEQKRSQSALEQVRQLFSELSQRNTSSLAAQGISSSSVADALSERLGREVAQRIAGVTDNANDVLKNIDTEKGRVVQFTQAKLSELERNLANAKQNIQLALQEGLNQVVNARNMANSQRAALRADVARQARAQADAAQQQAQQFAQQLYLWQVQRQAALDDAKKYTVNTPKTPSYAEYFTNPSDGVLYGVDKNSGSVVQVPGAPSGLFRVGTQPKKTTEQDNEY